MPPSQRAARDGIASKTTESSARIGRDTASTVGYRGDTLTGASTVSYQQGTSRLEIPAAAADSQDNGHVQSGSNKRPLVTTKHHAGDKLASEAPRRVHIATQERNVHRLPTNAASNASTAKHTDSAPPKPTTARGQERATNHHRENSQPNRPPSSREENKPMQTNADDKVTRLARELWAMDRRQVQLAKGIAQLRETGSAGAATEEVARAAEAAMEKIIAFEQRGDRRAQAKAAAEASRRKRVEDAREEQAARAQVRGNTKTNAVVSREDRHRAKEEEREQRVQARTQQRRAAEVARREREVEVLVEQELQTADQRVRSARAREVQRRGEWRERQAEDMRAEQRKDLGRRQQEVWRREAEREARERADPQMVRSRQVQDLREPYRLLSQVAPYAMQAQPMRNVLSRWKHPD